MNPIHLNQRLLDSQKVTPEQEENLYNIHLEIDFIFEECKATDDPEVLMAMDRRIRQLDFALQENWNFPHNSAFHTYWFKNPKCLCPKLDNADAIGTGTFYLNCECPVHYKNSKKITKRK